MRISNGWLHQPKQTEILIRLHGPAFKFFKERYNHRPYFVKVVSFDLRHKEIGSLDDDSIDDTSDSQNCLPALPSFSSTEIADLYGDNPLFHEQPANGARYQNDKGFVVYRTTSVAVEHLAFRFEIYVDYGLLKAIKQVEDEAKKEKDGKNFVKPEKCESSSTNSTEIERIGIAYCMPSSMSDTFGKTAVPILAKTQQPIGLLNVDYVFIHAIEPRQPVSLEVSYSRHWKKRHKALEVGHRGAGNSYTKFAASRENTIHSLNRAARNGADFVEFDVQLTKDKIPVVFHDFHVLVSVTKRSGSTLDLRGSVEKLDETLPTEYHELAVKDLKHQQLKLLHLSHHKAPEHSDKLKVTCDPTEADENQPFPTLIETLKMVDMETGFNIEIKFPMKLKDGSHECESYFERNMFIDIILNDVLTFGESRRIVFSSFDPDICSLISLKQNKYPVLFLCVGITTRYIPFLDQRSSTSEMAINFAASQSILGVNFHSEDLLRDPSPVKKAQDLQLVSFVWGDDLDDRKNVEYMKKIGVDGIIYDRIGEVEARKNVFIVEKHAKNSLFSTTPSPSRHGSLDKNSLSPTNSIPHSLNTLDVAPLQVSNAIQSSLNGSSSSSSLTPTTARSPSPSSPKRKYNFSHEI
uniref:GP-PDE domain-containing protein n=1 Tax=Panagrolaimus sp. PS1159 TaxID=55785 RepID=A0AC35G7B9_9BILA